MYLKKLMAAFLAAVCLFTTALPLASAAAQDNQTVQGRLGAIENVMYGTTQTGSLLDRINRLEKDYSGTHPTQSNMVARVDSLYNTIFENSTSPSLLTQMNAIEWTISHQVSMDSIQARVANMEKIIQGAPKEGTYKSRIESLSAYAFGGSNIPLTQVTIPANTLVKISLVTPVNTKSLKEGDKIQYQVASDVTVNGTVIFAQGAPGEGTVNKVTPARNFGRDAKIDIDFAQIRAIDGTQVDTFLGEEAKKEMKSVAMAAGASVAGMALLGPVGIVTGAFVSGKDINLPAGTEMYIQTKSDNILYGIQTTTK